MSLYDVVELPTDAICDHDPPSVERSILIELTGLVVVVLGAVHDTVFFVSEFLVFLQFDGAFGA